eukprot:Amastigsp_a849617_5.p3 type:complete len:107 gc:universal Amastigsp_a849617_5:583-903(+)
MPHKRAGHLGKNQGLGRQLHRRLGDMIAVVEPDTKDLGRNHRRQKADLVKRNRALGSVRRNKRLGGRKPVVRKAPALLGKLRRQSSQVQDSIGADKRPDSHSARTR